MSASKAKAIEPSSKPGNVDGVAGSDEWRGGGGGGSQLGFETGGPSGAWTRATGEGASSTTRDGGDGAGAAASERVLGSGSLALGTAGIAGLDGGFATAAGAATTGRTAAIRVESIRTAPAWPGSDETE